MGIITMGVAPEQGDGQETIPSKRFDHQSVLWNLSWLQQGEENNRSLQQATGRGLRLPSREDLTACQ